MNEKEALLTPIEPDVKLGYETSEFWTSLVSIIISNLITILTIFKVVPNEMSSTLSSALVAVVGGIITIIVAIKYIKSRTEIKVKSLQIQEHEAYRNLDIQSAQAQRESTKAQWFLQLLDRGVVDKDTVKKEFNLP